MPFELAMVEGGGILQLRGAEPFEIPSPTSVSGLIDDQSGAVSGGSLSTPVVEVEVDITDPVVATVFVDATFEQVSPGNLTGSVDPDGNVVAQVGLKVTLDLEVGRNPTLVTARCVTSPVMLSLLSVDAYDPESGRVTLVDDDFSIPPVPVVPGCTSLIADAVNGLLQGGGHRLSLSLEGDLELPPPPGDPTVTVLGVAPAGGARVGDAVTLSAVVAADEGVDGEGVPAGLVDFLDGSRVLGTVELDAGGGAELVTSGLPAGPRRLSARYRGGDGVFRASTSEVVVYSVLANPALSWDLPGVVQVAGDAADFGLTVRNTGFGGDLENARLDVSIRRTWGTGPIGPVGSDGRIVLSRVDGEGVGTPVELVASGSGANQVLAGSLGPATGFMLAAGDTVEERLRLELPAVGTVHATACGAANRLCPGPFTVTVELVVVDPDNGDEQVTLLTDSGRFTATEAARRTATIAAGQAAVPPPPLPPVIPAVPPVSPVAVRQGNNIGLNLFAVNPNVTGVRPSGWVEFQIDGKPVGARRIDSDTRLGYQDRLPVLTPTGGQFGAVISVPVPVDAPLGTRTLTVRYLGDALFLPAVTTYTFEVLPSAGPVFECVQPGLLTSNMLMGANLVFQGVLPQVAAAGSTVGVANLSMALLFDRGPSAISGGGIGLLIGVRDEFVSAAVNFSTGGSTVATGVSLANGERMTAAGDPDMRLTFNDLALSVDVNGSPGEVLPVTLDSIEINHTGATTTSGGATLLCVPVGGSVPIAEVTVAGTTLSVSPVGTARSGREVTLTATSAPTGPGGVVEFLDGAKTIGVVPVVAGQAVLTVDDLPQGPRNLTARSYPGLSIPSTASETVTLEILQAHECAAFAEAGNAAVVRLVYMELLRRCPDQAGFDYWVDRLDNGTTPEAFARSISRTPEAVGVVVNDGYQTMLGRNADTAGRTFWVGQLQIHGRYDRLLADLAASDEFWNLAGGTNEGFVTRVYDRLLNRAPDQGGLDYWVGRLDGGASRRALVLTLANLDEPLGVLVTQSYDEILSRNPFTGERATGITFLRDTGDRSGLYAQLIGRPEFDSRAQGFPNPED